MDLDINRAAGQGDKLEDLASKLNRVVQLTGFSDPVYAEAYVTVHQYDILMGMIRFLLPLEHSFIQIPSQIF